MCSEMRTLSLPPEGDELFRKVEKPPEGHVKRESLTCGQGVKSKQSSAFPPAALPPFVNTHLAEIASCADYSIPNFCVALCWLSFAWRPCHWR